MSSVKKNATPKPKSRLDFDKIKATLKKNKEKVDREIKLLRKESQKVFTAQLKSLFELHPKLNSFTWSQYTPYFNDGDSCEFSVNRDYLDMKFNGEEFEEVESYALGKDCEPEIKAAIGLGLKAAYKDIQDLFDLLDEEDFLQLFGDHVRVTMTAKGASVDGYDHE